MKSHNMKNPLNSLTVITITVLEKVKQAYNRIILMPKAIKML